MRCRGHGHGLILDVQVEQFLEPVTAQVAWGGAPEKLAVVVGMAAEALEAVRACFGRPVDASAASAPRRIDQVELIFTITASDHVCGSHPHCLNHASHRSSQFSASPEGRSPRGRSTS